MKKYEHYTTEDFVQDEDFRDWVQGSSLNETFWLSFLDQYPTQRVALKRAEQMVRAAHLHEEILSEKEIRAEVETFLHRAGAGTIPLPVSSSRPSSFRRFPFGRVASVAALIVAVFGLTWHYWPSARIAQEFDKSSVGQLVQTSNPTHQPLRILLSDSTEVVLSPKSSLSYPSRFSDSARVVFLTGEASFSVSHRNHPFLVRTGEMVTRVLGTKFVVSAYEKNQNMTVQVLSGKVSVYRRPPSQSAGSKEINGLILTANQAAIFEKAQRQLIKTLVANPILVQTTPAPAETRYDEVTLPRILHDLEQSYGIAIQFDEPSLRACKITATLAQESLYEKLDLLCKAISGSYEIVDGQIVINAKGCP